METLRDTAAACYEGAKEKRKLQAIVNAVFDEMDSNGDKRISFDEFKTYIKKKKGRKRFWLNKERFFDKLARDNKDYLVYSDVVTLLYIINSGRPFCEECGWFLDGLYLTCVQCFESKGDYAFNFCPSCYYAKSKTHKHIHKEFMDPMALLVLKKKQELVKKGKSSSVKQINSKPNKPTSRTGPSSSGQKVESKSNSSNAIIEHRPIITEDQALRLMEVVVSAGSTLVVAASTCTIM